ncbi:MAG: ribose-phosphate diphosphokinase [Candidatus Micrarchaeales archaeon]|jgi:ribose-phosphate pyrophosphokinase|uniref:ribose-phosphate diphosphokinase n=1 Tax=Candidatus Micrarchaeum acidiphilum ARMAN-2 TaxID=425595 RepID=C7DGC9_MICA2|nr:MAG: ribose-phosphate pyrophosphokinase [Candidatus Micrarchaeum acidiphilum ARMAN-2]MCW6161130.1 ribose-phosphate diphosphokinase [Candidatus Micrarchaeales archaeon]
MGAYDIVISDQDSEDLRARIAELSGLQSSGVNITRFHDGEFKMRLEKSGMNGKNVVLVHRLFPNPGDKTLELLLLCRKLGRDGARIHLVLPYMSYARQDREFLEGEIATIGILADILQSCCVGSITTVDMHSAAGLAMFKIPVKNLSASKLLSDYIVSNGLAPRPVVISPDKGGTERAQIVAKMLSAPCFSLEKHRDRVTGEVTTDASEIPVKDMNAIIIDDMIVSGNSTANAVKIIKGRGASSVTVAVTHGLFLDNAGKRIMDAGASEIISTNTLHNEYSKVDVSGMISESLLAGMD